MRAEAVELLNLLRRVKSHFDHAVLLLVFIDCLVLLQILQKSGRSDFWPDPRNGIHFDVIFPLLQEIHQWTDYCSKSRLRVMLVVNSMNRRMSWHIRAVSLTQNLSSLGSRSMDPCIDVLTRTSIQTLLYDDENIGHRFKRWNPP